MNKIHRLHLALSSNLVCARRVSEVYLCEENSKTYRRKSKKLKQKRYIETIIKEKKKSSQTFSFHFESRTRFLRIFAACFE